MDKSANPFCPALWFSGFFGMAALVHLVRLLLRVQVIAGTRRIPLRLSVAIVLIAGALSVALLYTGCKRPCYSSK